MLPPCQPHPNSLIDPRTTWRHHQQTQKPYRNIPDMSSHSGSVCFILWDPFPNELLHDLSSVIPSLYLFWSRDKVINKQLCRTCICFHMYIHIKNVNSYPPHVGVRFALMNLMILDVSLYMRVSENLLTCAQTTALAN